MQGAAARDGELLRGASVFLRDAVCLDPALTLKADTSWTLAGDAQASAK